MSEAKRSLSSMLKGSHLSVICLGKIEGVVLNFARNQLNLPALITKSAFIVEPGGAEAKKGDIIEFVTTIRKEILADESDLKNSGFDFNQIKRGDTLLASGIPLIVLEKMGESRLLRLGFPSDYIGKRMEVSVGVVRSRPL